MPQTAAGMPKWLLAKIRGQMKRRRRKEAAMRRGYQAQMLDLTGPLSDNVGKIVDAVGFDASKVGSIALPPKKSKT